MASFTCNITPSQSGPGSKIDKGSLNTPQISRTGALPSDAVWFGFMAY